MKQKPKHKSQPKKGKKHMETSHPKKPAVPEPVEAPSAPAPAQKEAPTTMDSNSDPKLVGGLQPIYCPQCGQEVAPKDSYHLSLDNKRYHYPTCWQRHELGD